MIRITRNELEYNINRFNNEISNIDSFLTNDTPAYDIWEELRTELIYWKSKYEKQLR